jgi:hypothetical protein
MPIRMFHLGFEYGNPGFPKSNMISHFFSDPNDKIVETIGESNVLMIGNFLQEDEMSVILQYNGIKIIYIGEPIGQIIFSYFTDELLKKDLYNYCIGSITNNPGKWIKYPLYFNMSINYNAVNSYVSTTTCNEKQLCTLINRHDWGNTRTPIFKELSRYMHVVCPGQLLNNCSNEELDIIGIVEYIKNFIFNICSENFGECHPGYITEKLMNCCLGGAIPLYFGDLDDIDSRIFNKNRILFLNEDNTVDVANRVIQMCMNPQILEAFYSQPVFMDTAEDAMKEIDEGVRTFFKGLSDGLS